MENDKEYTAMRKIKIIAATGVIMMTSCGGGGDVALETTTSTATETTMFTETTTAAPSTSTTVVVTSTAAETEFSVVEIIDGDTVDLSNGERVRLAGIDTPERGECGYEEAADALRFIIGPNTVVVSPAGEEDRDRYGRLIRYLSVDGADVGGVMITTGWAIARYDSRDGYGAHPKEEAYVALDNASEFPGCPQAAPAPTVPAATTPATAAPVVTNPPPPPAPVSYANCDAVRAAGAAPIRVGDPGWDSKFDRDGDGVGCEG